MHRMLRKGLPATIPALLIATSVLAQDAGAGTDDDQ